MSLHSEVDEEKFKEAKNHAGHDIVVTEYGDGEVAIECETCYEVLVSFFKEDSKFFIQL